MSNSKVEALAATPSVIAIINWALENSSALVALLAGSLIVIQIAHRLWMWSWQREVRKAGGQLPKVD